MSGDWWKQEEEFGGDDEFEWFQGDTGNEQQSGVGDDGGAFNFGDEDDFDDEQKDDDELNADSWMTSLTQMDNVLDGSIQKKETNKRNIKGKSMAELAADNLSKQPINSSFGTDDFFNQNANNGNKNDDDFNPFGLENDNNINKHHSGI